MRRPSGSHSSARAPLGRSRRSRSPLASVGIRQARIRSIPVLVEISLSGEHGHRAPVRGKMWLAERHDTQQVVGVRRAGLPYRSRARRPAPRLGERGRGSSQQECKSERAHPGDGERGGRSSPSQQGKRVTVEGQADHLAGILPLSAGRSRHDWTRSAFDLRPAREESSTWCATFVARYICSIQGGARQTGSDSRPFPLQQAAFDRLAGG